MISEVLIPRIKVLIAHRLSQLGYSQNSIAKILGVTQPAVNHYLRTSEEKVLRELAEYGLEEGEVRGVVERFVEMVVKGDYKSGIAYLQSWALGLLVGLKLCKMHSLFRAVDPDCRICANITELIHRARAQ